MKLYIKYMVSLRCKMLVKQELENLGIPCLSIDLGVADIPDNIPEKKFNQLKDSLRKWGLELMDDKKSVLIERIKNVIIEMIHYRDELPRVNYSDYISDKLGYDYTYLANLFSEVKGTTIQHFIIMHKIEKAKELLMYDEMNVTEIADKLHYSSVAHLSNQFKKITGLTPSFYKKVKESRQRNLEEL